MEARLEKVNGVRGEKLEAPEICHFFQDFGYKEKRDWDESGGIRCFQRRRCVENGERLCLLEAGW